MMRFARVAEYGSLGALTAALALAFDNAIIVGAAMAVAFCWRMTLAAVNLKSLATHGLWFMGRAVKGEYGNGWYLTKHVFTQPWLMFVVLFALAGIATDAIWIHHLAIAVTVLPVMVSVACYIFYDRTVAAAQRELDK